MKKKYTIEVPLYSCPIDNMIKINKSKKINIIMYGGIPNSPLNGGRFNYSLDGIILWNRFFYRLSRNQFQKVLANFHKMITKANQNNIPILFALTNMFINNEELNEKNLSPIKWLLESSQKHKIKNGLILNNGLLENFIRKNYGNSFDYISSCTKYVSPEKILTFQETLPMYQRDCPKYNFVVLTPQDSRRENLIKKIIPAHQKKIIAICNSYCANNCNSYYHYKYMSEENKKSLLTVTNNETLCSTLHFVKQQALKCSLFRNPFLKIKIDKIVNMQLQAGVVNFKIGRGLGSNVLRPLISLINNFEKNQ